MEIKTTQATLEVSINVVVEQRRTRAKLPFDFVTLLTVHSWAACEMSLLAEKETA